MTSRRTTTVSSPAVLNNALVRGQRTGFALLGFISLLVSACGPTAHYDSLQGRDRREALGTLQQMDFMGLLYGRHH